MFFAMTPFAFIVALTQVSWLCFVYHLALTVPLVIVEVAHIRIAATKLIQSRAVHLSMKPLSIVEMLSLVSWLHFVYHFTHTVPQAIQKLTHVGIAAAKLIQSVA